MTLNINTPTQANDATDDNSQTDGLRVERLGNTLRVTFRPEAPVVEYTPPDIEFSGGVTRVRVGGKPAPNESGLSFRKPGMGGVATEINKDTIVTLPGGMEVDVGSAIAAGLISPAVLSSNGAVGVFGPSRVAQQGNDQRTGQQPQRQQTDGNKHATANQPVDPAAFVPGDAPEALPGDMEADVQQLSTAFPTHVLDKTFAQLINNGMNFDAIKWHTVDEDSRLRSGEGRMVAQTMVSILQGNANRVVQACGVHASDMESFYDWARESKGQDLQRALTQYLFGRSANGFRSLAQTYLRSGPISEAALAAAQQRGALTYRRTTDGTITVTLPGRPEVPLATAQRLGWL